MHHLPSDAPELVQAIELENFDEIERLLAFEEGKGTLKGNDDPRVRCLRGYISELRGEPEFAYAQYTSALTSSVISGACRVFCRIRLAELELARACNSLADIERLIKGLNEIEFYAPGPLAIERERVIGRLLSESGARMNDLSLLARAEEHFDEAHERVRMVVADARQSPFNAWRSVEALGSLYLDALRNMLRLSRHQAFSDRVVRAWNWYSGLKRRVDIGNEQMLSARLSARARLIEFMAVPGERIQVRLRNSQGVSYGVLNATTEEAVVLQSELSTHLWHAAELRDDEARIKGKCELIESQAEAWSMLLLGRDLVLDGKQRRLAEFLPQDPTEQVYLLLHGPLRFAPWLLLRDGRQGPFLIEKGCVVIVPSPALAIQARRNIGPVRTISALHLRDYAGERGSLAARALLQAGAGASVLALAGHACYDWRDPRRSWLELGPSIVITLGEMVQIAMEGRPLAGTSVILAACEVAEVGKRRKIADFVHFPYAFILAGAAEVLAARWPVTSLLDRLMHGIAGSTAGVRMPLHRAVARHLGAAARAWRVARATCSVAELVRSSCLLGDLVPICDIAALDVHGRLPQRTLRRSSIGPQRWTRAKFQWRRQRGRVYARP